MRAAARARQCHRQPREVGSSGREVMHMGSGAERCYRLRQVREELQAERLFRQEEER